MMQDILGVPIDVRLLVACAAVAVGGLMRGFVGFGAALVIVPVMTLAYGPHIAVVAQTIIGVPALIQLLPDAIRHSERAIVAPMALAILLAAPFGTWMLVAASPALMKIVIAVLVLLMVAMLGKGWRLEHASAPTLVLAGIAGGLVQGVSGMGGPPVVAVALSRPGPPERQRGNVLAAMTAITISSVLPLWQFGLFTRQALVMGLVLLPVYILSIRVGGRYFARSGGHNFRPAALLTLAVIGATTLLAALRDYLSS
ncbi:MAG: sulfite exporter TauE/SafE family protein [Hyphomicrobiaceae bacterium]